MKKTFSAILASALAALLLGACALTSFAGANGSIAGPEVEMEKAAPRIDGVITSGEYLGEYPILEDTFGYCGTANQMLSGAGKAYFSYDSNGIYFAVDFTEMHDAYSICVLNSAGARDHIKIYPDSNAAGYSGPDGTYPAVTPDGIAINHYMAVNGVTVVPADSQPGAAYWRSLSSVINTENEVVATQGIGVSTISFGEESYWDGDVFALSLDLLGLYKSNGAQMESAPQYGFGITAGGDVLAASTVYGAEREVFSQADITGEVTAAGTITRDKFVVEALIPWARLIDDAESAAACFNIHNYDLSVDALCADDAVHTASVTFYDRFIDSENDTVEALGCYITTRPESYYSNGLRINDMAIKLNNRGVGNVDPQRFFDDVPEGWYAPAAVWCLRAGIMSGTADRTFSPAMQLSRAQVVRILAALDGVDLSFYPSSGVFDDVPVGKWYSNAVEWANRSGYAAGTGEGKFSPDAPVTREQLAVFLYAYAAANGKDMTVETDRLHFEDAARISPWARTAMYWAFEKGLITGTSTVRLSPQGVVTRSQAAVIFMKFAVNVLGK